MLLKRKATLRLIAIIILAILFLGNSFPVSATTPVNTQHGIEKDEAFIIYSPWTEGVNAVINAGNLYGEGDHTDGLNQYYAIDFNLQPNNTHQAIYPAQSGYVVYSDFMSGGLGNTVILRHNYDSLSDYYTLYGHLDSRNVTVNTTTKYDRTSTSILGWEGKTGGTPTYPITGDHLHFAVFKCNKSVTIPSGLFVFNGNCKSVIPEPLIGREVYEGFSAIGRETPLFGTNTGNDSPSGPPSSAGWGAGTTSNLTTLTQGQNINFVVVGLPSDTKEVRLTAWYDGPNTDGWSTMDGDSYNQNWRILARCWPGKNDANCSWLAGSLSYTWNLYSDTRAAAAPWQDFSTLNGNYIDLAYKPNVTNPICISFDVFDYAGNVAYAPAGVQCDPVLAAASTSDLGEASSAATDSARLINVSPNAPPSTTWSTHFYNGQDHWWDPNSTGGEMCNGSFGQGNLDQNYGDSSPCSGGATDNWVGDYKATVNFQPGYYAFWVDHDDGLKLRVDGREIYSVNGTHSEWKCVDNDYLYLSGNHDIWAILAEQGGQTRVKVEWSKNNGACDLPLAFNKSSPSNGLDEQSFQPTLSWNAASGAQSYSYCINTTNDKACTIEGSTGLATSVNISDLIPGATYYWQVKAYSQGGVGVEANNGVWWSFTTQSPTPPFNLLMNGSFEEGTDAPSWWDKAAWQMPYSTFEWSDIFAHSGIRSIKISNNTANDSYWSQAVNVQPNSDYRLSGWIMTDNVAHSSEWDDAGANLSILDGSGSHRYTSPKLFWDNPWTYVTLDFNTAASTQITVAARLGMYSGTTTGWAWFDDLKLVLLSTPTCYTLSNTTNPIGEGSILALPAPNCNNSTQYIHGTTVMLTAAPNVGNSFSSWGGGVSGTPNPIYLTLIANKSVTANFIDITLHKLFLPLLRR